MFPGRACLTFALGRKRGQWTEIARRCRRDPGRHDSIPNPAGNRWLCCWRCCSAALSASGKPPDRTATPVSARVSAGVHSRRTLRKKDVFPRLCLGRRRREVIVQSQSVARSLAQTRSRRHRSAPGEIVQCSPPRDAQFFRRKRHCLPNNHRKRNERVHRYHALTVKWTGRESQRVIGVERACNVAIAPSSSTGVPWSSRRSERASAD